MTRMGHIIAFLGIFAVLMTVIHLYLFLRFNFYLQWGLSQRRIAALILGSLLLLTVVGFPASRSLPREMASWLEWVVFPWMGCVLLLLVVMLVADILWFVFSLLSSIPPYDPQRRNLIQYSFGISVLGLSGFLSAFSLVKGLRQVTVKPLTIALKRLPASLDGLRVVQITDLHIGPLIHEHWLQQVVDQVNDLKPDLIVLTGDVVDGSVDELKKDVAPLAQLKAALGVFFITGNHEYYSGVEPWCDHMAHLGLQVLRNARVSIKAGDKGDSFDLAGVDDWASHQFPGQGPDLPGALKNRDPHKLLVLLAHQPAAIEEAAAHGVDLQLSGHTHGGQIWPFNYLVHLQQPYVAGLHRHRDTTTQIYVSSGTGFWGPPMRFGTTAEITHITLRSSNS